MWRKIKLVFAGSIVTLSLGMTIASSFAQERTADEVGLRTRTLGTEAHGFDLGWLGLGGLAGLIGLMPRDRRDASGRHITKRQIQPVG